MNEIKQISVLDIIPNRFQPRLVFDEQELEELSNSIKMHGIIQPLVLRQVNDKYEIIAGERRYKASCLAGLQTVPAIIMNIDDNKSAELAVVENLQRRNLTAIEEAQSYKKILDKGYLTQEELAGRMGVTQPTIANKLRLLSLEKEVQDALLGNKISERHARSLLKINDPIIQVNMLHRIINERLTVRQTDSAINKILGKSDEHKEIKTLETPKFNSIQEKRDENSLGQSIASTESNINSTNIFDLDPEKIKKESQELFQKNEPIDINELIKPQPIENKHHEENNNINNNNPMSMNDIISNSNPIRNEENEEIKQTNTYFTNPFSYENINKNLNNEPEPIKESIPVTPFVDEPEIIDFFNAKEEEKIDTNNNSIISEFRQMKANQFEQPVEINKGPNLSSVINKFRNSFNEAEQEGFNISTEEFDFEDMYQIVIKIKKDN